ncbi:MAG: hypothetical protein NT154_05195 [Verrucomicrobia bacterium]|nr:hypothetical protein [Verrucomicrobiota bacterium]
MREDDAPTNSTEEATHTETGQPETAPASKLVYGGHGCRAVWHLWPTGGVGLVVRGPSRLRAVQPEIEERG